MIDRFSTRALFAFLFSLVASGAVFPLGSAYGGWFSGIGVLEGGTSSVGGLSADGQVVVGASLGQPIRWTRSGGISRLVAGGFSGGAYGASGDGSVIVGSGVFSGSLWQAFRWTASSGMQNLGTLGAHSIAVGVSGDGSAVVGGDCPDPGYAFYWTAPGPMVHMVETGGASGISDDGTVIVGQMSSGTVSFGTAAKWTRNGSVWEPTPLLPASSADVAADVTPNGSVIVGFKGAAGFRWTASGWNDIPIQANAVSDNGALIVGTVGAGPSDNGDEAYLWDSVHGARTVKNVLLDLGMTEVNGWDLTYVADISGDGTVIAGLGFNRDANRQEGWVANLSAGGEVPAPASVLIWVGLASLGVLWGRQGRRSKSAA